MELVDTISCVGLYNRAGLYMDRTQMLYSITRLNPNLNRSVALLRFRDGFGLKKVKIKKNSGLIYLSVLPIDLV